MSNDKLNKLMATIRKSVEEAVLERKSGQLTFVVNVSQGGVGDCEVITKSRLK